MTLPRFPAPLLAAALVTACAGLPGRHSSDTGGTGAEQPPPEEIAAIVAAPRPETGARTADQFDTTTDAQREAASAAPTGGETRLGETIASLGDPTEGGLWLKTPLVDAQAAGRIEDPATGRSAVVELRPAAGSGGSQVSLAAMRLLDVPLTSLPTLVVYRN